MVPRRCIHVLDHLGGVFKLLPLMVIKEITWQVATTQVVGEGTVVYCVERTFLLSPLFSSFSISSHSTLTCSNPSLVMRWNRRRLSSLSRAPRMHNPPLPLLFILSSRHQLARSLPFTMKLQRSRDLSYFLNLLLPPSLPPFPLPGGLDLGLLPGRGRSINEDWCSLTSANCVNGPTWRWLVSKLYISKPRRRFCVSSFCETSEYCEIFTWTKFRREQRAPIDWYLHRAPCSIDLYSELPVGSIRNHWNEGYNEEPKRTNYIS